jgi:general secretion pathway protein K
MSRRPHRGSRGAAVVMAMLVVALAVALVSGVFQRQSIVARQIENDAAFAQAQRLMDGAVDWVRVILREDARTSNVDHGGEAWAVSLEQTRLDNDNGEPAWVAGGIEDLQARFNLRNLSGLEGRDLNEERVLGRLLALVGSQPSLAPVLAARIDRAVARRDTPPGKPRVSPATLDEIDFDDPREREALELLRPFVTLLPVPSPVNANTASAEVLHARYDNLSLADARRLVESRGRAHFLDLTDMAGRLPGYTLRLPAQTLPGGVRQVEVFTQYFQLRGAVEYRRTHLHSLVLLKREGNRVEVVWKREASA